MLDKSETDKSKKAQDDSKNSKHRNWNTKYDSRENDGENPSKAVEARVLDNAERCKYVATCKTTIQHKTR